MTFGEGDRNKFYELRDRGYLPHLEIPGGTYFLTVRLVGTLPQAILESWKLERQEIVQRARLMKRSLSRSEEQRLMELFSQRIDAHLDRGAGACWLAGPEVARKVVNALKFFDRQRYDLWAWTVMPNHFHTVVTLFESQEPVLDRVLHSWKSYTANEANRILKRKGRFWQREYFDRLIRDLDGFFDCVEYTLDNPVKAGLVSNWEDWPWSGARVSCLPG